MHRWTFNGIGVSTTDGIFEKLSMVHGSDVVVAQLGQPLSVICTPSVACDLCTRLCVEILSSEEFPSFYQAPSSEKVD
jgi:hypothetical protein